MAQALTTTADLAGAREEAAERLQDAIAAVALPLREYNRLTAELGARVHADLAARLEIPMVLHLASAGLGAYLERKLQGTPAPLRALVSDQHSSLNIQARPSTNGERNRVE